MPTQASITLNDGETTPVSHTFVPFGEDANGVRKWREYVAANPSAARFLTIGVFQSTAKPSDAQIPGKDVSPRKVITKMAYPLTYVDSTTGLTLVDNIVYGECRLSASPRAPAQACKNVRTMLGTLFGGTSLTKVFDEGEPFSG